MFKRSQQEISQSAKHWYQDKYQHVLTQRNILALIALVSLVVAAVASLTVLNLAPLKSVEPYLLQVDEKTGITQHVKAFTSEQYSANRTLDEYFTASYLRVREGYNPSILGYNQNIVRLMSTKGVFSGYTMQLNPENPESPIKRLGASGQRTVRINTMAYINTPGESNSKVMQVRFATIESMPNAADKTSLWIATIRFEYAEMDLNADERRLNPIGYTVTSYQIESEVR